MYASRTNPLLYYSNPPSSDTNRRNEAVTNPFDRNDQLSRENSSSTTASYQSRALPLSFAGPRPASVDRRATPRHESRLTNPNEIAKVGSHYFPGYPRHGVREYPQAPQQQAVERRPSPELAHAPTSQFGAIRGADGFHLVQQANNGSHSHPTQDDQMEIDGNDEPEDARSKKRSRTLTTAHQTEVLTTLLNKTRFPSTETRQEIGQQIGMSSRRVQIWFQNRRQSQKRARDRDMTDVASPSGSRDLRQQYVDSAPLPPLKDGVAPVDHPHSYTQPAHSFYTYQTMSAPNMLPVQPQQAPQPHRAPPPHSRPVSVDSLASYTATNSSQARSSRELPQLRTAGPTETLMTLPESPQSISGSGWNGGKGVDSYRISLGAQQPSALRQTPSIEARREFLCPPMETFRPENSSPTNSIATTDSSRAGHDSLLKSSSMHSRTSSDASSAWDSFADRRQSQNSEVQGAGGRRNLLPPIGGLLEIGHTELSKKGLPAPPPYLNYSLNQGSAPGSMNFGRPPPAPSTGARSNNYHHHAYVRNRSSEPSLPPPLGPLPQHRRSDSMDSSTSNYDNNDRASIISLPKIDLLRISHTAGRNSISSSRSSVMSRGSERDSFYSFQSEDSASPAATDVLEINTTRRTSPPTLNIMSIPSYRDRSKENRLLDDGTTLAPILSTGNGLGFNVTSARVVTRLPSLSAATAAGSDNDSTPTRDHFKLPPIVPLAGYGGNAGLLERRPTGGREMGGRRDDRSFRHDFVRRN